VTLAELREIFAGRPERLAVEPGRSLVGPAGLLLTRVEYVKARDAQTFFVVDAAMNDLMRPALYEAWHAIEPVLERPELPQRIGDVVGPVCETGDFLGRNRALAVAPGDLLAILCTGAYGMAMSSQYNTRPRAAEVLVCGNTYRLIRRRERVDELFAAELSLL
jgi:diaminopimelate decarboxylase